jgi:hypothetical protein
MGSNGGRPAPARYASAGDDSPALAGDVLNYEHPLP